MKTLLSGGTVYSHGVARRADILVEAGKIIAVEPNIEAKPDTLQIDASGKHLLPGFIDLHVHLDDTIGEFDLADSYETGSCVAIQNGITTIWSFITQQPQQPLTTAIETAKRKAGHNCWCDYGWHLTPTTFDEAAWQEIDQWIEKGFRTFKFYTTYREAGLYLDYPELQTIFQKLSKRVDRILVHCEDETVLQSIAPVQLGDANALSHTLRRPATAEIVAVSRVCEIARDAVVPLHVVHVSSPESVSILQQTKRTSDVTCETAPHYFTLCDDVLRRLDGYRWLCSPPLRDIATMRIHRELAAQPDYFDIFATDHCPFRKKDKVKYRDHVNKVPNGIAGLGALPHLVAQLHSDTERSLLDLANRLSESPARILNIYPRKGILQKGSDADIVMITLTDETRAIQSSLSDVYESYPDQISNLSIALVMKQGEPIVIDGKLVAGKQPGGNCLCLTE
ncbi:MAG: amidohydrolase family protein [bacterium]|nr:amidohydrolase family protein [bacterium]